MAFVFCLKSWLVHYLLPFHWLELIDYQLFEDALKYNQAMEKGQGGGRPAVVMDGHGRYFTDLDSHHLSS